MNEIDRQILLELQQNARVTNQELSEKVGLSPTPCLRRVRMLESSGVIKGYGVNLDPEALGLTVMAFVQIRLERQTDAAIVSFENGIKQLEEVVACYMMSGSFDYLLHVMSPSLKDYERFIRDRLTRIDGIGGLETHFVFDQVKENTRLPGL